MKPKTETDNKNDLEAPSKIELIKNLIFGENIEAYESEFERVKQDILAKKKVLEELIRAVQTDLKMSIDDVSTDINIRITELEDKLDTRLTDLESDKTNNKELGDLLIQLGQKIQKK